MTGAAILFDKITVTGTENLMMAAALAEGRTVLENAAREPEVVDLAELAEQNGRKDRRRRYAHDHDRRSPQIEWSDSPDHSGSYRSRNLPHSGRLIGRRTRVDGRQSGPPASTIEKLREAGVSIDTGNGRVSVKGSNRVVSADVITREYPGFATDMQAQYMALMTQATGISVITENIFENRFMHASELMRMGANIRIDGSRALVAGKTVLTGATVIASDLRASASLILAALVADGTTVIDRVYHLDRGYEKIEEKLRSVGAQIERLK